MSFTSLAKLPLTLILLCTALLISCTKHAAPPVKRYPFTGRVVSVDKPNQSATIDGDTIQGFMEAMEMSYKVKNTGEFNQLAAGDAVSAEVVVVQTEDKDASPDYWLENVKVTAHSKPAAAKPTSILNLQRRPDSIFSTPTSG